MGQGSLFRKGLHFSCILSLIASVGGAKALSESPRAEKEWTFLLFLNGNNNLDRFGALNINQMEQVGSSDQVNMVVQWASYAATTTKRLYVERDSNFNSVTSPVIETLPRVDMGSVRVLNEFIEWGVRRYPAKKYFVAVWNHGSGWHLNTLRNKSKAGDDLHVTDISFDDYSRNHITTEQLGTAMQNAARVMGHSVDLYGSDACLMGMAEVADEMRNSVRAFVGSQDLEPGEGWPYHLVFRKLVDRPTMSGVELGKVLTEEYLRFYRTASRPQEVTMSAYDLETWEEFRNSLDAFGSSVRELDAAGRRNFLAAVNGAFRFDYADYADLKDMIGKVRSAPNRLVSEAVLSRLERALSSVIVANGVTPRFSRATGMSVWMPSTASQYRSYSTRYQGLELGKTGWGAALQALF